MYEISKIRQITVLSGKGGTGKTSITAALSQVADAVIADTDVAAPNLHLLLQPTPRHEKDFVSGKIAFKNKDLCSECEKCLEVCRFDAITPSYEILDDKCEGCGACKFICPETAISLQARTIGKLISSITRFGKMCHAQLKVGGENSGHLVNAVIESAHLTAKESNKNIVIVDGSPGIGCPVISSLTKTSLVIIVTEPSISAIHDMKRLVELVNHFKLPIFVIVNKADINYQQRDFILRYVEEKSDINILGELPYNIEAYHAMVKGQTLIEANIPSFKSQIFDIWEKLVKNLENLS